MKIINQNNHDFLYKLNKILDSRTKIQSNKIDSKVQNIINEVKTFGDKAIIKYTKKYDNTLINKSEIKISNKIIKSYRNKVNKKIIEDFKLAIKNITNFHQKQFPKNYQINKKGIVSGILWKPIESVGLYVPGGKISYPSSLIMNTIPALVAGVKRIVVTTPSNKNNFNPYIMVLLDILGIKEVYQVGGAQAIAALAYGTQTIKPVNKIFGPGNSFVISAKKQVFGKVGIDLMAGPSEIVVVADSNHNPTWVASDLIAQAEHDEKSQCILITDSTQFAIKVKSKIKILLSQIVRKNVINQSLKNYGAILILKNLNDVSKIIDIIAPEHLHLHNKNSKKILNKINNAGCVFLGEYSAEAFGDYIVGTNHILPTSGSAKYSSGLSVLDFMKRTSFVGLNRKIFNNLSNSVCDMASIENLDGHKLSVAVRQTVKK